MNHSNISFHEKKAELEFVFGKFYTTLYEFYQKTFQDAEKYDEIIFFSRRGFVLAELFYHVFLEEWGEEECKTLHSALYKFRTESRILSHCESYAQKLKEQAFPKILFVDELVVQGDTINDILIDFEETVFQKIKSQYDAITQVAWQEIKENYLSQFTKNIHISVAFRSDLALFINPNFRFTIGKKVTKDEIYEFSNRVRIVTNEFPLINMNYYMGVRSNFSNGEQIRDFTAVEISSKELESTVYFFTPPEETRFSATIRVNSHLAHEKKTIIPHIFLPELEENAYRTLVNLVSKSWKGWSTELFPKGTRLELEGVYFFLGMSLLKIFSDQSEQLTFHDLFFDSFKASIHFGDISLLEHLVDVEDCLWNQATLMSHMKDVLVESPKTFVLSGQATHLSEKLSEKDALCQTLEDYVYALKIDQLEDFLFRANNIYEKKEKAVFHWTFSQIITDFLHKNPSFHQGELLCWLLQFLDRDILGIREIYAVIHHNVPIRTGESSYFVYPKRYYPISQFLAKMEKKHDGDTKEIKEEITLYFLEKQNAQGKVYGITKEELWHYVDLLEKSGQTLGFWKKNLFVSSKNFRFKQNRERKVGVINENRKNQG